ncbi:hypothetical protein [Streptomyces iconiensis]|uniref:Helix-turn-helix domain-containing protein n=1 Tax=Streptomyces iconiensis TaxID=1384038 RepID=A0ABT7A0Y7_9ACTN|nr:hypothetical protein [Streptomyces iconiensis]MDJ1134980.1 hypothetical protein [Streptomyces iconiensis]
MSARGEVPPALCGGDACRRATRARRPAPGLRLCPGCLRALSADITALAHLHEECAHVLDGGGLPEGVRERITGGGGAPGIPFNAAAADVRRDIAALLGSWSALVCDERGLTAPRATPAARAAQLLAHVEWLAAHPAAADLSEETARLKSRARRTAHPGAARRTVTLGACVEPGCPGTLTARLHTSADPGDQVRCTADPAHVWPAAQWTRLSDRMGGGGTERRARWLTAAQIATLFATPTGSVYRLASEGAWRRRKRAGRTYYLEDDVRVSLSAR